MNTLIVQHIYVDPGLILLTHILKYRMHELTSTFLFSFIFSHTHKFKINCAENNTTKAVSVLVNYKCVFLRLCMH